MPNKLNSMMTDEIEADLLKKVPKCHRGHSKQEVVLGKETILRLYNENYELESEDVKTEFDNAVISFIEQRAKEMGWPFTIWNHDVLHLSSAPFYLTTTSTITIPKETYPK